MRRTKLLAPIAVLLALVLGGCAPAPTPKPTATKAPAIDAPSYNTAATQKPAFTVNGSGSQKIQIDFPAGYKEPSIVTLSATGNTTVRELNFDGDNVSTLVDIQTKGGGSATVVKYPTVDTPARTSNFQVEADPNVSWAISAEAIGSVPKLKCLSASGTSSRIFMLDVEANTVDFVTTGIGSVHLSIISLNTNEPINLGGGSGNQTSRSTATQINAKILNFKGYVFMVTSANPDTQGWQVLFSQQNYS